MSEIDNLANTLQSRVEEKRRNPSAVYGPGSYFYWFLAHHLTSESLLFADLRPDAASAYLDRSGELFVITSTAVLVARYSGTSDEVDDRDPAATYGTADVSLYPRKFKTIEWKGRDLRIPKMMAREVVPSRLQPDSLRVVGDDWERSLPGERVDDADQYFRDLINAAGFGPVQ